MLLGKKPAKMTGTNMKLWRYVVTMIVCKVVEGNETPSIRPHNFANMHAFVESLWMVVILWSTSKVLDLSKACARTHWDVTQVIIKTKY